MNSKTTINRVTLVGHVGKVETRYTPSGLAIVTISMATQERIKDGDSYKYVPEWHRVICFGKTAEIMREHANQGTRLFVEGYLKTNKFKDKVTGQARTSTQINASHAEILSKQTVTSSAKKEQEHIKDQRLEDFDDLGDLPF